MADQVTVYLEAYACDEHGDGPRWARLCVDAPFLARLTYLAALVQAHRLASVTTYDSPDEWDAEDELRLRSHELVVSGSDFWFTAAPKHASYQVETRLVEVNELVGQVARALESDDPVPVLFFGEAQAQQAARDVHAARVAEAAHG